MLEGASVDRTGIYEATPTQEGIVSASSTGKYSAQWGRSKYQPVTTRDEYRYHSKYFFYFFSSPANVFQTAPSSLRGQATPLLLGLRTVVLSDDLLARGKYEYPQTERSTLYERSDARSCFQYIFLIPVCGYWFPGTSILLFASSLTPDRS